MHEYTYTQLLLIMKRKKNNAPFLIKRKGPDTFILNPSYHFFALAAYFTNINKIVFCLLELIVKSNAFLPARSLFNYYSRYGLEGTLH